MKTDAQLQIDVVEELRWDPSVRDAEIGVSAKDGVITLSGVVESYAEKHAATRAAQRVAGVRGIAEDLIVRLSPEYKRSDTDLAHAVVSSLRWDTQVPHLRIKATVENGWVTLAGDVEWQFQKDAAMRAVRHLTGVVGVSNNLVVKPKTVSTFAVSENIKAALRRLADREAERITIDAADGRVTLEGHVSSFGGRLEAERAAWSAPGVSKVEDRITVRL